MVSKEEEKIDESKILHLLGEEIDTEERVLIYPKEHLLKVYEAAIKQISKHKKVVSASRSLKRLKPIPLIDDKGVSVKNRTYFKDVKIMVQCVTASESELKFFNFVEKDPKFQGYCYSPQLNKILRVYDGKCYKTVGGNKSYTEYIAEKNKSEDSKSAEV